MTILADIEIRCDWCGVCCGGQPLHGDRVPLTDAADRALNVEALMVAHGRGTPIPSPPGQRLHLCRSCRRPEATPPRRLPTKKKRNRKNRQ